MKKTELTEGKLNELKEQTRDRFTLFLIEDLRIRLSSEEDKEIYKKLDFDRIINFQRAKINICSYS